MERELLIIKTLFKDLLRQPIINFPKPRKSPDADTEQGVYIIRNPKGIILHVGRTLRAKYGLWQRLYNHLNGQSSFVAQYKELNGDGSKLRKGYTFQYLLISS